ncbi:MAG: phosphonopyruvate decarboxylase, partial [Rhodospirillales bacterium]|nr:phosphonopyruvate decarboxylase [Rhodospirillales bacterium]
MITAVDFLTPAIARGWSSWTGVPCSFLTPLINGVASDRRLAYVPATSEGEAIAIAAGAWFAGRRAVAMMQNSGLGNAVNPLTSLCAPFRIPLLTLVTWRGQPGLKDEPQHELMGRITQTLLDTMEIAHAPFPTETSRVDAALDAAEASMAARSLPFCFVMEKDSVADSDLNEPARTARPTGELHDFTTHGTRPARAALLERALAVLPDEAAVIATTGKSGRELFTLADRD